MIKYYHKNISSKNTILYTFKLQECRPKNPLNNIFIKINNNGNKFQKGKRKTTNIKGFFYRYRVLQKQSQKLKA